MFESQLELLKGNPYLSGLVAGGAGFLVLRELLRKPPQPADFVQPEKITLGWADAVADETGVNVGHDKHLGLVITYLGQVPPHLIQTHDLVLDVYGRGLPRIARLFLPVSQVQMRHQCLTGHPNSR